MRIVGMLISRCWWLIVGSREIKQNRCTGDQLTMRGIAEGSTFPSFSRGCIAGFNALIADR
jgi:hypothetical protein